MRLGRMNGAAMRLVSVALLGTATVLAGGCSKPIARASLLNQTGGDLSVMIWPAGGEAPRGDERLLTAGGATGYQFDFEGSEPQLAVWAEPAGGNAQLTTLEPPGPHLIEVRRAPNGLQFIVRRDPGAPGDEVPTDARRRGFNNDIPPVNPGPGGGFPLE
ncbi:MAG: hypothetical protein AAGI17_09510 [Planctomycetota bacterium]